MLEIYQALQAHCPFSTRDPEPTIALPATLHPAPHLEIINPQLFITTALLRLESDSPRLRVLAERTLKAVIIQISTL